MKKMKQVAVRMTEAQHKAALSAAKRRKVTFSGFIRDSAAHFLKGQIGVNVRDRLFEFASKDEWISTAPIRFRNSGYTADSTISVDQNGLICARGKQFEIAKYPVTVYAIDDQPFKPTGALGKREETGV